MNIVFVGTPGTPYSQRACDVRLAAFANMIATGNEVTILNRYSRNEDMREIPLDDEVQVKEIINKKPFAHGFWFLLSLIIEPFSLLRMGRKNKVDILHVYSGHYLDFLFYRIIGKLLKAKVVYQYVEYRLDKEKRGGYFKWNSKKCDLAGAKLWDGVIGISDFLIDRSLEVNPELKTIKVTPICDFSSFERIPPADQSRYLLFCGSIAYREVVDMIVGSYRKSLISKKMKLILVLGGNRKIIDKFIEENIDIIVYSGVKYDDLIGLYKGAIGLFIPLRNTLEDTARFPNKICEYLAARGLIITTKYGEMSNYFVDKHNALVADDFSENALSEKLDWLAENLNNVDTIKGNAQKELFDIFDQNSNAEKINKFLSEL